MKTVAVVRCESYRREEVLERLRQALDLAGDWSGLIKPGQRVLIKPNLVTAVPPERAVTTHPAVVEALVRLVQEAGGEAWVGESPGYGDPVRVAERTGILEVCRATGARFMPFRTVREVSAPEGRVIKRFPLAAAVTDADLVLSIAKLKTHGLMVYTGVVKNLFGCIVGLDKPGFHLRLRRRDLFGAMLLDLFLAVRPAFAILDGIVAMEGEGPSHGDPRPLKVLLAGSDGLAVDDAALRIIGVPRWRVPYLEEAQRRGLLGQYQTVGLDLEEVAVSDFRLPTGQEVVPWLPPRWSDFLARHLSPRPLVNPERCLGCGVCAESCPPKAISVLDGQARIDERSCIRCYCCQELCPRGAVDLRRPWISRWSHFGKT